ncbi:MAG: hypothetical protein ACLQIB_48465 [Isosphaeraceae bacterium]
MQNKPKRSGSQSRRRARRRRFEPRLGGPLERRTMLSVVAPPGVATPSVQINAITTTAPYGPSQVYQGYGFNRVIFQQGSNYYLGNGAGQTIALVDAFNDGSIASNLASFDTQMGLPAPPTFKVLNQTGGTSLSGVTNESGSSRSATYGWSIEESLDVEWAHTIAPDANIVLFEANTNSNANLYTAVETAAKAATYTQYGLPPAGVVSNSYGSGESATETASDPDFTSSGNTVTFVFSSGDSHPVEYPSTSPNVLAVGGTRLNLQTSGFGTTYNGEGWYNTSRSNAGGGGSSAYETEPSYQLGVQSSGKRQTPDVSMNADGNSDVLVLDTNSPYGGYYGVYGTSEAAPMWAATLSIVDQGLTLAEGSFTTLGNAQAYVYQMPGVTGGATPSSGPSYHDVTGTFAYVSGSSSHPTTTNYTATPGYDTLTGLGSPVPTVFIPNMINYALTNGAHPAAHTGGGLVGGGEAAGGNGSGSSGPGGGYSGFNGQPSGNFVGGGHLTVVMSPSQTAQPALPIGAAPTLSPIGALQTSSQALGAQSPSAFSPTAASAFVPAVMTAGSNLGPTAWAPVLAAPTDGLPPDGLPPAGGTQPASLEVPNPSSGQSSPGASIAPDRVVGDSAALLVLAPDTLPGVFVQQSSAEELPGMVQLGLSADRIMVAGMALMLGTSWGVFTDRKTRFKQPSLRPPAES